MENVNFGSGGYLLPYPVYIMNIQDSQQSDESSSSFSSTRDHNSPNNRESIKEKTILCGLWLNNQCHRTICHYSHNPNKIRPDRVPDNFKTIQCEKDGHGFCAYHFHCNFIHAGDLIIKDTKKNLIKVATLHPSNEFWVVYRIGRTQGQN